MQGVRSKEKTALKEGGEVAWVVCSRGVGLQVARIGPMLAGVRACMHYWPIQQEGEADRHAANAAGQG